MTEIMEETENRHGLNVLERADGADVCADFVGALEDSLANQVLYREILLKILDFCRVEQRRCDVESYADDLLEGMCSTRTPGSLVESLLAVGGMIQTIVADGARMAFADYEATLNDSERPRYDEVFAVLATTEAGRELVKRQGTLSRLSALCDENPRFIAAFAGVVELCRTQRSFGEVGEFLQGKGYISSHSLNGKAPIHPSFVLEGLQATGAISWIGGWKTTEEGERALEFLRKKDRERNE